MKSLTQAFVVLVALLVFTDSYAEMYTNVTATRVSLKSDTAKVQPYAAVVKFGYRFAESLAVEAMYGSSANDDSLDGGKVEIDKMTAIFIRMGGQSTYNGVRSYLLLGTSTTEVKYSNVPTPGETKLEGTAWGIGLEESSQSVRNMSYVLEYVQFADDKDTKVTGISLGVRYTF